MFEIHVCNRAIFPSGASGLLNPYHLEAKWTSGQLQGGQYMATNCEIQDQVYRILLVRFTC